MDQAARPAHADHRIGFETFDRETVADRLPVSGSVPRWLRGTLVRTAPSKFEVGEQRYRHWFDGLAMLHAFALRDGQVSYRSRFLQSGSFREADAKGRIVRGEFATDPCRTLFQRVASIFSPSLTDNGNVNVARLGGDVVAMTETRLPIRIDPETLKTLGGTDVAPGLSGPVSVAHPHTDAVRGCQYSYLLDFGYTSRYRILAVEKLGTRPRQICSVATKRPAYMHSFAMTDRYLVFVEFPLVVNPLRLKFSGQPFIRNYRWLPERGTRFHVIDKETGAVVRRAETDPVFAFHHVNAFETRDEVVIDMIVYPDASVIDQLYLDRLRAGDEVIAAGILTRFRIDRGGEVTSAALSDTRIELPRINYPRHAGRPYRYVFAAGDTGAGDFLNCLVKLDLQTREVTRWREPGCYPGEPVFVAEPAEEREDGGVLLSIVLDTNRARSFLLILDAVTLAEVARAELPHRTTFGFHGNFLASSESPDGHPAGGMA